VLGGHLNNASGRLDGQVRSKIQSRFYRKIGKKGQSRVQIYKKICHRKQKTAKKVATALRHRHFVLTDFYFTKEVHGLREMFCVRGILSTLTSHLIKTLQTNYLAYSIN
jgi:hypothetical protein